MTIQELIETLGVDEDTARVIKEKVKAEKIATLKAQKEYEALMAEKAQLESELVGDGKTGARAHKLWYSENYPKIQQLQVKLAKFVERYGELDAQPNAQPAAQPNAQPTGDYISKADLEKMMQGYTGQWSGLVKGIAKLTTKHVRNGRKTDIDVEKISQMATEQFGGDIERAYDEWDKPEATRAAQEAEEKRINAEVEKRMKAKQTNTFFPSTESTPSGSLSPLSKDRGEQKYDRNRVIESALSGVYEPSTVQ